VAIVRRAIEEPLRQIAQNGGAEGAVVVGRVRDGKSSFGYNAASVEYGDLFEQGVIEPVKVVRTALQNAASVASLLRLPNSTTQARMAVTSAQAIEVLGGSTRLSLQAY